MRLLVLLGLASLALDARAGSFSDGGNGFLKYDCSTAGNVSPDCAEYALTGTVTAKGVVNASGGFDIDYFDSGAFGGFFAENLELPFAPSLFAIELPQLLGSAEIDYDIAITQAERGLGDPSWATHLFAVEWDSARGEWALRVVSADASAPLIVGDRVYFWSVEYPAGTGTTFATLFSGSSAAPFQALGLALVPEPGGLAAAALAALALARIRAR